MIISKQQNGDRWNDYGGDAVGVLSCSGFFLMLFLLLFPGTRESVVLLLLQHLIDVQEGTCRYNEKNKLLLGIASIETTSLLT